MMHRKVVVVTGGAGGGIGHGITTALAREGWEVLVVDVDESAATDIAERLTAQAWHVSTLIADLTDDQTPQRIVQAALERTGRLDGLVNSAGVSLIKPAGEITDEEYDNLLDVNLRAMFRISRAAQPELARHRGSIVNVSSVHAHATMPGYSVYAATKAAILGLTRGLAIDFGPSEVRVNCILPGLVDGPQNRALLARMTDDVDGWIEKFVRSCQLLPHVIQAEEAGDLVGYLLSERARSITGQSITIDAGVCAMLWGREVST